MADDADIKYRKVIDRLVHSCRGGQGQIGPERVRIGVWNRNPPEHVQEDQQEINRLLLRLSPFDRSTVAEMLEHAYQGGVHECLVVLHEQGIEPFDKGYEGTPFHDFVGRLGDWPWPTNQDRC